MSDWEMKLVFYKEESVGGPEGAVWAAGRGGAAERLGGWAAHSEKQPGL